MEEDAARKPSVFSTFMPVRVKGWCLSCQTLVCLASDASVPYIRHLCLT